MPPEEHADIAQVPGSLDEVLQALEDDHDFLLAGDVFTADLIETWIELKRAEIDALRQRPTLRVRPLLPDLSSNQQAQGIQRPIGNSRQLKLVEPTTNYFEEQQ